MCKDKKLCGMWHVHVAVSKYNKNGACACIDCFGGGCHNCATYRELADEVIEMVMGAATRCQLCQAYIQKTK